MMPGARGYAVVPGPFGTGELPAALAAVERASNDAKSHEIHLGSTGTNVRVEGILDRAPILAALFTHQPLLKMASENIRGSFRLSSFHLRSVLPGAKAQALHQDVRPGGEGWPLVGFIFMVDQFTAQNGGTRFVASAAPGATTLETPRSRHPAEEPACGPSGSMIIFDGSLWHGFGANLSAEPRRSIYGALVPGDARVSKDYAASLRPAVWAQLSKTARDVLLGRYWH